MVLPLELLSEIIDGVPQDFHLFRQNANGICQTSKVGLLLPVSGLQVGVQLVEGAADVVNCLTKPGV
ncbi:hypothetical protein Fuma_05543 [Fuerstiella marisgermanici]|uniref:Uncharacterized protein n=1 Tax=Fuerstiella marisgermanici TaxID=1891926 RepID=A0A1P8WP98_9PLAN|nr:hypothetical protein Fuma_05543 [Fuerstiella marisgermanici]